MSGSITLDEFFEEEKRNVSSGDAVHDLQFTGNWFIDAGILGFVNLMEEVYGWDLENLREFVRRSTSDQVRSAFTYAFWYKVIKDTTNRWLSKDIFKVGDLKKKGIDPEELSKSIRVSIINKIQRRNEMDRSKVIEGGNPYDIILSINEFIKEIIKDEFSKYESELKKAFAQNKKTLLEHINSVSIIGELDFFRNLSIFNPSSNKAGKERHILSMFEKLVFEGFVREDKEIKSLPKNVLDKSLSPFIYSASEFPNEYYGRPMTLKTLETVAGVNPAIYLLCVPFSFIWYMGKYYLFYAPSLEFSYHINKRLRKYVSNVKDESNSSKNILKITWQAIIDTLIEFKSYYSLENMYILEFSGIENQQLQNVEYIGIPKLQASILIEDPIREALNNIVSINDDVRVWVLEEFIKNKPLYDVVLKHVSYCLREKNERNIQKKTSLYALAIDAKIKENNEIDLFSNRFLEGFRSLVNEIKDCYSIINSCAINISQLFDSEEERRQVCYSLISALKKKNRIAFANILLKKFLEKTENKKVLQLNRFVFKNIILNDISWENYALALVIGILGFGGGDVGEEPEE